MFPIFIFWMICYHNLELDNHTFPTMTAYLHSYKGGLEIEIKTYKKKYNWYQLQYLSVNIKMWLNILFVKLHRCYRTNTLWFLVLVIVCPCKRIRWYAIPNANYPKHLSKVILKLLQKYFMFFNFTISIYNQWC